MIDMISVSIGIGLAVSLVFSEVFGLAAGGMVVPGYFAMYLDRPIDIILTIACAFITYLIVHLLSSIIIIYGRRRTVLMILVGYLTRAVFSWLPLGTVAPVTALAGVWGETESLFTVIGYIIPGLVAIWMDRQGPIETLSALTTAAVVVRLILILIFGVGLTLA
jgi:gamma-polyglutamate biosynthesis protein CapC